ncbi:MAG: gliding motility-associated C-terminal domain-containing protein [Prevotellaceae bacterium]|jgi:gliding motility-associated-like protein|nr:gliding motility-associated C-terminal domain-containing protein [Prevotellaceae bacterium]
MYIKPFLIIVVVIALALFTSNLLHGQMVNTNADYSTIMYDSHNGETTETYIYAFYSPKPASLKAKSVDGNAADFEWYRFDQKARALIATPIKTEQNVLTSEVNNLLEDGYLLRIIQGETIDTFRSWVFLDTIKIEEIYSDNNCNYLRLTVKAQYRPNYYWYNFIDLESPQLRLIQNNFRMEWSASDDIRAGLQASNAWQNVTASLATTIDDPAPLKEAEYSVTMTNIFNNKAATSTQKIPYLAVYADFEVLRPNDADVYSPTTDYKGEALYKVKFNSKSINADEYTWQGYGDQLINFEKDKVIWMETSKNIDNEKEYRPGEYPVVLTVKKNSSGCIAATPNKGTILLVEPSKLDPESIPNAFSPNGDGHNDYFKFVTGREPVSLEYVDIKIFNRTGLLVYKYNGLVKNWNGWDGRFKSDGGECETGVYYYIIKAQGWDNITYSDKSLTGFLHLFR